MTISAAGFGHQINWEDDEIPPGHTLNFKRSIEVVGAGVLIRIMCPKWIFEWAPTKKIREARDGFAEFRVCPLRARLRTGTFRLNVNAMYAVILGGDD